MNVALRIPLTIALAAGMLVFAIALPASADFTFGGNCLHDDGSQTTGACSGPSAASTNYSFQRNGIFGCNQTGSYSMSVGALSAVGGVFVPVNDAAVTLNTGYLVYKECVLRGIVDRMRENETASLLRSISQAYERGRQGLPLFSQNLSLDQRSTYDETVVSSAKGTFLDSIVPAFRDAVKRAVVQGYMAARNVPNQAFACPYQGNISAALNSSPQGDYWDALGNLTWYPGCNPYFAYDIANSAVLGAAATNWGNRFSQLQFGNGSYPVTKYDADGNEIVVTPPALVSANIIQAEQTGFTQLQNANDIDQIIGALFAGITTQVLSDQGGLSGIVNQNGAAPSYLDRVVQESAQGLRNSLANSAIQILTAARQAEQSFLSAMQAIAQNLSDTAATLRAKELACWNIVTVGSADGASLGSLPHVCYTGISWSSSGGPTCKAPPVCTDNPSYVPNDPNNPAQLCVDGPTLHIATTTVASHTVIGSSITPLASSTANNVANSQDALVQIGNLIINVSNSDALDAQRLALQQLDNLVFNHALHNQYDAQNAQQTKDNIAASMSTLVTNTVSGSNNDGGWANAPDVATGWCNVKNPAVISAWQRCWNPVSTSTCPWQQ
jgi:hypothetical protein